MLQARLDEQVYGDDPRATRGFDAFALIASEKPELLPAEIRRSAKRGEMSTNHDVQSYAHKLVEALGK